MCALCTVRCVGGTVCGLGLKCVPCVTQSHSRSLSHSRFHSPPPTPFPPPVFPPTCLPPSPPPSPPHSPLPPASPLPPFLPHTDWQQKRMRLFDSAPQIFFLIFLIFFLHRLAAEKEALIRQRAAIYQCKFEGVPGCVPIATAAGMFIFFIYCIINASSNAYRAASPSRPPPV
jgi:hypothetical protein